jgi:two-component system sensor kinase
MQIEHTVMKPVKREELRQAIESACRPSEASNQQEGAPGQHREGVALRILVADDSPVNQEVARGLLELFGHHVTTVSDGQAAVDVWAEEPFDLILMDIEMPVMDGLAAARRIREREQQTEVTSGVPIVALSAHVTSDFTSECLRAGMNGNIGKPIQPEELLTVVKRCHEKAPQSMSPAAF